MDTIAQQTMPPFECLSHVSDRGLWTHQSAQISLPRTIASMAHRHTRSPQKEYLTVFSVLDDQERAAVSRLCSQFRMIRFLPPDPFVLVTEPLQPPHVVVFLPKQPMPLPARSPQNASISAQQTHAAQTRLVESIKTALAPQSSSTAHAIPINGVTLETTGGQLTLSQCRTQSLKDTSDLTHFYLRRSTPLPLYWEAHLGWAIHGFRLDPATHREETRWYVINFAAPEIQGPQDRPWTRDLKRILEERIRAYRVESVPKIVVSSATSTLAIHLAESLRELEFAQRSSFYFPDLSWGWQPVASLLEFMTDDASSALFILADYFPKVIVGIKCKAPR